MAKEQCCGYGKGTDVLTKQGWLPIEDVFTDDTLEIGQFNVHTKEIGFCKPTKRICAYAKSMKHIKSHNFGLFITGNQDILIDNNRIPAHNLRSNVREDTLFLSGITQSSGIIIDDNFIRLLTWIICDATIVSDKKYKNKKRIQFHLSKQRKIDTIECLLNDMDISYTKRMYDKKENRLQDYFINIYGKNALCLYTMLSGVKEFPQEWRNLNEKQLSICLDTIAQADGYIRNKDATFSRIQWITTNKNDVDIISQACIKNNYLFKYSIGDNRSGFTKNCKRQYVCIICKNKKWKTSFLKTEDIPNYNDNIFNFMTSYGTIITRYNGRTAISYSI